MLGFLCVSLSGLCIPKESIDDVKQYRFGVKGAFADINVADADLQLAKTSFSIFGRGLLMDKDKITNKKIIGNSEMPVSVATGALFGIISGYKIPLLRLQEQYNHFVNNLNSAAGSH